MIVRTINERKQALINSLLQGGLNSGITDFATYRYLLGQIQGLECALNIIQDNVNDEEEEYGNI